MAFSPGWRGRTGPRTARVSTAPRPALVRARPPDPGGPRRRLDVRRRPARAAAAVPAPAGDGRRGGALRLPGRPLGAAAAHQHLPRRDHLRHRRTTRRQRSRAVRAVHERVRGTTPDGTPYAASDPHLLGWVHAAEIDSFLRRTTATARAAGRRRVRRVRRRHRPGRRGARRHGPAARPRPNSRRQLAAYRPELAGHPAGARRPRASCCSTRRSRWPRGCRTRSWPPTPSPFSPTWAARELGLPRLTVVMSWCVRPLGLAVTSAVRWVMAPSRPATMSTTR